MARVLLIEDDVRIRSALANALADHGHDVESEASGLAGIERALGDPTDVVVLDLGLPDIDGTEVLRMIRAVRDVPVIVATARDDEREIVQLLDAGADDYLTKPFSSGQLEARIRAVLRRSATGTTTLAISVGGLTVDPRTREATLDGEALELTRREFDLLAYLAERQGSVISKRELLSEIWRMPYGGADKTVDVHLSWLRRKLGESAAEPSYLHTVRGVGIKLTAPDP